MIKPNELRIGNKVWESNSFTPGPNDYTEITVASINDIDKVIRDIDGNGYSYDALYGIPITPELLERCGLEFHDGGRWIGPEIKSDDMIEWFEIQEQKSGFKFFGSEWAHGKPFFYLHQIQNLYFALTDEELTIKESA